MYLRKGLLNIASVKLFRKARDRKRCSPHFLNRTGIFLAVLAALIFGWVLWLSYLSRKESLACGSNSSQSIDSLQQNQTSDAGQESELQAIVDRFTQEQGGVGIQVSVIQPGELRIHLNSGYADLEKKCKVTSNHHFQIGSMTKLFTAALVMYQVEKGRLSLDDRLSRWYDFSYANQVTLQMLLNQTSGIPDYAWNAWFLARLFSLPGKQWQPAELMQIIENRRPGFPPGMHHEYSNTNYLLLGLILERMAGQPYGHLLRSTITSPLELDDTFFQEIPPETEIANGYDESLLRLGRRNLTALRPAWRSAAFSSGGILSTSEDVAEFTQALFTGQILREDTVSQMLDTMDAPDPDLPEQVGYGFGIRRLFMNGEYLVGHTGTFPGYSGITMYSLEKGYTIAILSNLSTIDQVKLIREIQVHLGER